MFEGWVGIWRSIQRGFIARWDILSMGVIMQRVIIYPEPGETWCAPMINQWEQPGLILRDKLIAAGYEPIPDHDLKEKPRPNDLAIYFDSLLRPSNVFLHKRSLYISLEPPCVNPRFYDRIRDFPFSRVLTFHRELCDNKRIFYSPFPVTKYEMPKQRPPIVGDICAITANKKSDHPNEMYTVRREVYRALGSYIDVYGKGWPDTMSNYKGPVDNIFDTFLRYKYCIVIENQYVFGYTSEKYFTPIQAGCEPLIHIGWKPDYTLDDANEGWASGIVKHLQAIS